jgi:class 3 adenylate cyclase
MAVDLEQLSLTEIIRLRELISEVLVRRFERSVALAFSDVVGSTAYFAEYGDEAGRGLQQRHIDILMRALPQYGGRIVDTAGDGAFMCFPSIDGAIQALIDVQRYIIEGNQNRPVQHHLAVRVGIHWGPVLTDGVVVTGDAVNLCARITGTGHAGEMRATKQAFLEMSTQYRILCTTLPPVELKGIPRPVEIMMLKWNTSAPLPAWVVVQETGERIKLPQKPVISFGRVREHHGMQANDVVLDLPDAEAHMRISRWHFELRQTLEGYHANPLSEAMTEVDGQVVPKGTTRMVRVGSVVRLAGGVITLLFQGEEAEQGSAAEADRHTRMFTVSGPLNIKV